MGVKKSRLDLILVDSGMAPTREKARALIMAGRVLVNGSRMEKPGREFPHGVDLSVTQELPYVSRGGLKLEAALACFGFDPAGLTVMDCGASTGGFTDCLLKRGAARVTAIDVGYGQLDWGLRQDPRVTLIERANIRLLDPKSLPYPIDAAVADLSFISLKLVLPKLLQILGPGAALLPLVKPQFEVGRGQVGKGGIVRDQEKILETLSGVAAFADELGFYVLGQMESPIRGQKGNREFFLHLKKKGSHFHKGV